MRNQVYLDCKLSFNLIKYRLEDFNLKKHFTTYVYIYIYDCYLFLRKKININEDNKIIHFSLQICLVNSVSVCC